MGKALVFGLVAAAMLLASPRTVVMEEFTRVAG